MASEQSLVIECQTKDEFNDRMDKAKKAGKLAIINLSACWSGPCRFISAVFFEYAKKHPGAVFLKVDVDGVREVAEDYKVNAVPTFHFVKNGETVETFVGANKEQLQAKIDKHVRAAARASA